MNNSLKKQDYSSIKEMKIDYNKLEFTPITEEWFKNKEVFIRENIHLSTPPKKNNKRKRRIGYRYFKNTKVRAMFFLAGILCLSISGRRTLLLLQETSTNLMFEDTIEIIVLSLVGFVCFYFNIRKRR